MTNKTLGDHCPVLLGIFDRDDLLAEFEYRVKNDWYDADDVPGLRAQLLAVTDDDIIAAHEHATDAIIEDLPQEPISYVMNALKRAEGP